MTTGDTAFQVAAGLTSRVKFPTFSSCLCSLSISAVLSGSAPSQEPDPGPDACALRV